MTPATEFDLLPCPICPQAPLGKSLPLDLLLEKISSHCQNTRLQPFRRLPGIAAYRCQGPEVTTFGKGFSAAAAQASALMEQWERRTWYNYPFAAQEDYRQATFAQLFIARKSLVNAAYFLSNLLQPSGLAPYLPQLGQIPLHWLKAWSFTKNTALFYPVNWHNICYTSNGLAAGANSSEALLQGLCEVIERENIWRWLLEEKEAAAVDPATITDGECRALLAAATDHGVELIIRDMSFTADLPCYTVYGRYLTPAGPKIHFSAAGHGCHPQPLLALKRALAEYLASHEINAAAAGTTPGLWQGPLPQMSPLTMLDFPQKYLEELPAYTALPESSPYMADDLTISFNLIVKALAAAGYEVAARRLNPGADLPVVRVIVPTMRAPFGTEVEEFLLLLAQVAHEGGQRELAMDFIIRALENPASALHQQLGNGATQAMVPRILRLMGSQLFFGPTYQETFRRADKFSTI